MGEPDRAKNSVTLLLGDSPEVLWQQVALPWVGEYGLKAWQQAKPVVVVVPHRTAAFAFKQGVLQAGKNLLGVEVWTPLEVRQYLRGQYGRETRPPVSQETLELVLRLSGCEVIERHSENRSAAAVVADPGAFRQILDRVLATGIEPGTVFSTHLSEVIQEAQKRLAVLDTQTSQEEGFWLERESGQRDAVFSACLSLGFTGEDWVQMPLLTAAFQASESATVGLLPPAMPGEEADQLWISTLEERFEVYQQLEPSGKDRVAQTDAIFYLTKDLAQEAELITAQVVSWLAEDAQVRIGVAIPPGSSLGLLVATQLSDLEIPIHSRFGFRRPGMLEEAAWRAWLSYLSHPKLTSFLELAEGLDPAVLRALAEVGAEASYDFHEVEKALEGAYQYVLSEELSALAGWMEEGARLSERIRCTLVLLQRLSPLPREGELGAMWQGFVQQAQTLGWYERVELLLPRVESVLDRASAWRLKSTDFVSWLQAISDTREFTRPTEAHHFYARVHLVTPNEASGQTWTHLFLAGLSEGEWPPQNQEDAFLSRRETQHWQRRLRSQFRRWIREGQQGEGQEVLPMGLTWPREYDAAQTQARRAFQACWEMRCAGTSLACSAHLSEETRPSLPLLPSEFFLRALRESEPDSLQRGGVDEMISRQLLGRSAERIEATLGDAFDQPEQEALGHTEAYKQRRAGEAFSSYEFTLEPGSTPPRPLRLSCREWERALQAPVTTFMQHLLGVTQRTTFSADAFSARSRGVWTHQWLGGLAVKPSDLTATEWPPLVPLSELEQRQTLLREKAKEFRERATAAWENSAQLLPAWWLVRWEQALGLSLDLAASWNQVGAYTHAGTEWVLHERPLCFGEEHNLWLRGRVDGLLADDATWQEATRLLILDYKTGSRHDFGEAKMFRDASGVQLALYAMLLSEMVAAAEINVAMVSSRDGISEALSSGVWREFKAAWLELVSIQNTGFLGWRLPLRDAFAPTEALPLATLAIPVEIGRKKWRQAHPNWGGLA